jgi:hypothetical protein
MRGNNKKNYEKGIFKEGANGKMPTMKGPGVRTAMLGESRGQRSGSNNLW